MNLTHLHSQLVDSGPPPPPIFQSDVVPAELWSEAFDAPTGPEAWQRLCDDVGNVTRPALLVTRHHWEQFLEYEIVRRGQRQFWIQEDEQRRTLEARACEDFWHWVYEHGWLDNRHAAKAENRLAPFVPWPGQFAYMEWFRRAIVEGVETQQTQVRRMVKSRAAGASWAVCLLISHCFLFQDRFSALIGSITQTEVDDGGRGSGTTKSLLGRIDFILGQQPRYLRPRIGGKNMVILNLDNGSTIHGQLMTANFARGDRVSVIVRDEAARLEPRLQEAAKSGATSVALCELIFSTPNGKGDAFHRDFEAASGDIKLTAPWPLDPRRDLPWRQSQERAHGGELSKDMARQEYDCSFAGISGTRIWDPVEEVVMFDENTPEWSEVAVNARRHWLTVSGMDFGTGPSPTVAATCLVDWSKTVPHAEYGKLPRMWWVSVTHDRGARPAEVASQIEAATIDLGGPWFVYGDPAGVAEGIDQHSWQTDLVSYGVPLTCLPAAPFHDHHFILRVLTDLVPSMLELGLWRIHRQRCQLLYDACEQWQWDLPRGVEPDAVSRDAIKWKKDGWSHFCEAMWYAALAAILYHQPRRQRSTDEGWQLPLSVGGELAGVFGGP